MCLVRRIRNQGVWLAAYLLLLLRSWYVLDITLDRHQLETFFKERKGKLVCKHHISVVNEFFLLIHRQSETTGCYFALGAKSVR